MEYQAQIQQKIQDWDTLQAQVQAWQAKSERVVFTNGCFDILHYGHLHYLAEARDLGDHLVIGLNSAASVSRLKGAHRPIQDEKTREFMLASLAFVSALTVFEQDTPLELIQHIKPDILVKGGDYKPETIVGADVVMSNGGEVKVLSFVPGYSTTAIETKIRSWK